LFNVGVELGQVAFVALCLVVQRASAALEVAQPRWAPAVSAYVVGSLGAYWAIAQVVSMAR
jgi:hypothetical protein